jgi:hypothetical protein
MEAVYPVYHSRKAWVLGSGNGWIHVFNGGQHIEISPQCNQTVWHVCFISIITTLSMYLGKYNFKKSLGVGQTHCIGQWVMHHSKKMTDLWHLVPCNFFLL